MPEPGTNYRDSYGNPPDADLLVNVKMRNDSHRLDYEKVEKHIVAGRAALSSQAVRMKARIDGVENADTSSDA
jgi:hypothetical protein